MHRNRHKHHVHVFCHMFCGWQLINDFTELQKLNSGMLEINVKDGTCLHNGSVNSVLTMPKVLSNWFTGDSMQHNIDLSNIKSAVLEVSFHMNEYGVKGGKSPEFKCKSTLVSRDSTYHLDFQGEHGNNEVEIT